MRSPRNVAATRGCPKCGERGLVLRVTREGPRLYKFGGPERKGDLRPALWDRLHFCARKTLRGDLPGRSIRANGHGRLRFSAIYGPGVVIQRPALPEPCPGCTRALGHLGQHLST